MKNLGIAILVSCISPMLILSCNQSSTAIELIEENQYYVGSWVANGSHPIGYSHGNYVIQLDLAANGTCKMNFKYDLNKTTMSEKFSYIVELEGTWNVKEGRIQPSMKIIKWVVTDLAGYRKEESFDDFVTDFDFKLAEGRMVPADRFDSNIKFGTTKDARDMLKMDSKGSGILLYNVEFTKNR